MILDVHAELLSMSLQHTEAEKVERLRASPPSGGSVAGGEPPELDQPGLALVKRQAELLQPVLEVREELLPIRLELAAEDHIVRIPADDHLPGCPTSSPLADPEVDDVVEEHIGEDRADPRPLRRACLPPPLSIGRSRGRLPPANARSSEAPGGRRSCAPASASAIRGRRNRTKTPQTTHSQDLPTSVVITRRRHPFQGCRLAVINGLTRRGVPLLLVVLPDGSRSLIPSTWTDWFGSCGVHAPGEVGDGEDLCAVGDLIKARAVIDALLSRLAESAPEEEGDHAVGVGVSRTARGAGGPDGGALGSDRSAGPDRSAGHPLASHRADARGRLSAGDKR